jgi:hypothetical protein
MKYVMPFMAGISIFIPLWIIQIIKLWEYKEQADTKITIGIMLFLIFGILIFWIVYFNGGI